MFRNHFFTGMLAFFCTLLCAATPLRADAGQWNASAAQQAQRFVPSRQNQITQAIDPTRLSAMHTGVPSQVAVADDLGLVADNLELNNLFLLLHRPAVSEQALEEYMQEQADPNSPNYHHWLTAEQVGEYGPAPADIDTVTSWLESQGFSINRVAADNMTIDFSGSARLVNQAFHTEIHTLSVEGETHFANVREAQIPSALAPAVVGIVSLNDFRPHPASRLRAAPAFTFGSGGPYALVPADLATIYNITPLTTAGITGSGQTIDLIENSDVYSATDISTFRSTFGLPANSFTTMHPNCTDPGDVSGNDFEVELDLEYAGAAAQGANLVVVSCPTILAAMQNLNSAGDGARLWSVSYESCEAGNGQATNAAFSSVYQTAAARGVSVFVAAGDAGAASCDVNATAATHGIGVNGYASTPYNVAVGGTDFGDSANNNNTTYWNTTNTPTFGSAKSYIDEIPWNDSCASQLFSTFYQAQGQGNGIPYGSAGFCNSITGVTFLTTAAGSGGPSGCATGTPGTTNVVSGSCAGTAKPSWQSIVGNPSDGVRDLPDVSLFAGDGSWQHFYVVCYSGTAAIGSPCTGTPDNWSSGGGTSFSTSIMAGIQALINQKAGSSQGNPNPTYYALASAQYGATGNAACSSTLGNTVGTNCIFYDIKQGDMDVNCTGSISCYFGTPASGANGVLSTSTSSYVPAYGTTTAAFTGGAASGWDFATGIGSVNVCNLVDAWPGVTSPVTCATGGGASKLAFTLEPNASYASGATITVKVSIENSAGAVVTTDTSAVTLVMTGGTPSATLSGTKTVNAVAGVATFSNLSVDKIGTGYLLNASDGTLTRTTATFNITPGAPSKLVITQQPTNAVAGTSITPSVTVAIEDAVGNLTTDTSAVTLAIGTNPGGGTLSGTKTVNAVAGVATFPGLSINKTGTGYTLAATDGALTGATSSAFNITPGPAAMVAFVQQPTNTVAGAAITPSLTVAVEDAFGNIVPSDTSAITVAIGTNPGGGTLSGTKTVNAVAGVATFAGLSINKTGTGYTLAASDGALTGGTSSTFNITPGAVNKLAFVQQPTNALAGASITPSISVAVQDINGNVVTTDTSAVTLAIGTNPGGGTLSGTKVVNAVAGVATFPGLSINKVGTGYTLTASDAALTGATSNTFNIAPGAAAKLVFVQQPTNTVLNGSITPSITVAVEDANGNVVTTDVSAVTMAIGTNPSGGTLNGTKTVNAVSGVATFANLSINQAGVGYTLTASDSTLTAATSNTFNITPPVPVKLSFVQQPTTAVAGASITPSITVSVLDAAGNVVTTDSSAVTLAIGTNPGGGTLGGTVTVNAVNGVATFPGLSINKTGIGYTLAASDGALTGATSNAFNITPGTASKLAFVQQPTNTTAGTSITPALTVAVEDANGNVVTTDTSAVTIAIGTNPGGGTLSGTKTVNAVAGVATFSTLSINKTGTGYTLAASDGALTAATSGTFNITFGAAAQVVFVQQPTNTVAGASITPSVTAAVQDALGNVVTSDTSAVTLAIGTNPGGGTLGGTKTVNAVAGLATFAGLSINKTGTGYTLAASDGVLTGATSSTFNITPGAANKLAFVQQPTNTVAGASITPALTVAVEDTNGNIVASDTSAVTLAIGANPGGGALTGTKTVNAVAGVATFSGLSINLTGAGYTLTASDGALTGTTSNTFNITPGAATKLAITQQPTNTAAGASITPAVTVAVEDALGNVVTSDTSAVTIAIGTNPVGGTLSGTKTVNAVSGVATFSTLSINKTGTGYTLAASDGALTSATSGTFNITFGAAAQVVFVQQPTNTVAGASITPSVTAAVQDALGNVVTSDTSAVTLAIGTNPGGGTLGGTKTVNAVNGVATFAGLSINKTGTGYTLAASDGVLTGATSNAFNITPGAANKLAFVQQPTNTVAGSSITPSVTVAVEDTNGNVVPSDTSAVTVAIGTNPSGGTLSGTKTVNAVAGVATFSGLSINQTGTGYTLTAADGALTGTTSAAFNIVPSVPTKLAFVQQPTNTIAGASIAPAITVAVQDASGNVVTSDTSAVTIAIGTNAGGGTLSGANTVNAVNGVATFAGLSINKSGTGYTLAASDGTLTGTTSGTFNITPGAATKLAITQQPTNTAAGASITPAVTAAVEDSNGNVVTSDTSAVTIAIGTNPGGGTLSGTTTVNAVSGVATFAGLSINKTGTGYTLAVTDGALTGATSGTFNIVPAAASKLAFVQQPTNTAAGASISPSMTVAVQDGNGNVVTTDTSAVTLAIGTNPGGGTLTGTKTVNAVNGVATFAGLSINNAGTGYTLTASDGALAGATSGTFNIAPAAAAKLVITQQPTNTAAGASITPAVTAAVEDTNGNVVTSDTSAVTLAIGTNPGGGTLSGTKTVNAVNGVATFPGLSINKTGTGYTLTASDGALTGATSSAFNITPGAANKLAFVQQPTNTLAAATITPAVTVAVEDTNGNVVTSDTSSVTIAIGTNPGGGTLSGTTAVNAVNGVATFSNLSINQIGTGYTLAASDGALGGATSAAFNVTSTVVNKLVFLQQPTNTTAGASITPAVTVAIEDGGGNIVTSDTSAVTVAIGTNPNGGTLSGTKTVNAVNGVATFSNLSINRAGTGYTLTASDGTFTGTTSNGFNITAGAADHLRFTQQPTNTTAGASITPAVTVAIHDVDGNLVSTSTASVTIAIGNNPGGSTLGGTATVAAVGGIATFNNLTLNKSGSGYTLTAASTGLTGTTSSGFEIRIGPAAQLVFTTQPSDVTRGNQLGTVAVTVEDAEGNTVLTSASVDFTITACGGSVDLGSIATSAGVATLNSTQRFYTVVSADTITAKSGALTGTSAGFNVVASSGYIFASGFESCRP